MRSTSSNEVRLAAVPAPDDWEGRPAVQQPQWRNHPAYRRTREMLAAADPLVTPAELAALRRSLSLVAAGGARLLQVGDCAESFYECTPWHTSTKLDVLGRLARHVEGRTGQPVIRVARIGGQFAKPRSQPVERLGEVELPVFRGHLVNSEVATRPARQHDPRRMVWAYEASAKVLGWAAEYRKRHPAPGAPQAGNGPWASHEALVVDYESALARVDPRTGRTYLGSTHLPWIGERTRQPGSAHVGLAAAVANPVGCKLGPGTTVDDVLALCALLDPAREPGRLVLIPRLGHRAVAEALPPLVAAVRRAGHPVVWLCDPMHGNTVVAANGLKTRYLADMVAEARAFRAVLERYGLHPGGLHLEVAASGVTECVGGAVRDESELAARYTTLCDPRLNPDQALELVDRFL